MAGVAGLVDFGGEVLGDGAEFVEGFGGVRADCGSVASSKKAVRLVRWE